MVNLFSAMRASGPFRVQRHHDSAPAITASPDRPRLTRDEIAQLFADTLYATTHGPTPPRLA